MTEKFESKLDEHGGNLKRAAVALAQLWRSDKAARNLEALMIVADKEAEHFSVFHVKPLSLTLYLLKSIQHNPALVNLFLFQNTIFLF